MKLLNKLVYPFLAFGFCSLLFTTSGCKKDDDPTPEAPLELWENVVVIDTATLILNTSSSNFSAGVYVFQSTATNTELHVNDIIIGTYGEGYLRKVTGVNLNGNTLTLQTNQATLSDVFKNGSFNFNADMNEMLPGKTSGFSYSVSNHELYSSSALNIKLSNANLEIDPNWFFDFTFSPAGINYFEMSSTNAPYSANAQLKLNALQSISLVDGSDTLSRHSKTIIKLVPVGPIVIPVVLTLKLYWIADYSATMNAAVSNITSFSSSGQITLGVKYQNDQWQSLHDFNTTSNLDVSQPTGAVTLLANCNLRPVVSAKLYGVAGPRASAGLMSDFTGVVASPSLDWDLTASTWLRATAGADVTILGNTLIEYPDQIWDSPRLTYHKPDRIVKIMGDAQEANQGTLLHDSIVVRVLDSEGAAVKDVPVRFNVTSGGGIITATQIATNADGEAGVQWLLGNQIGTQTVQATVKKGNLVQVNESPVTFTATANNVSGSCPASITDIDGNAYNVVQVGNQCWMLQNLKTSRFRNGQLIGELQDSASWRSIYDNNLSTSSWCYYGENASMNNTYGKLYNWLAASDSRGLCPSGWHVPTNSDWDELVSTVGGEPNAGMALKSVNLWTEPNNGTNSSGWTGVPGGGRSPIGGFSDDFGTYGTWWSATEYDNTMAHHRMTTNDMAEFIDVYNRKEFGHSVRCLKD